MKYTLLLLLLLVCGLGYIHSAQPDEWNQIVKAVNLPQYAEKGSASSTLAGTDSDSNTGDSMTPPHVVPVQPELITPNATNYMDSAHVHEVEQPAQPAANPPAQ